MTEMDIAKAAFEFIKERDKKYCRQMSIRFDNYEWNNLNLRQWNAWISIAKWHKKEMARLKNKAINKK
jgi:hypothetical protein